MKSTEVLGCSLPARGRVRGVKRWTVLATSLMVGAVWPEAVHAQDSDEEDGCLVLCAPELDVEPTLTIENLIAPPRIENVSTGEVSPASRETVFEAVLALGVPTELPYIELSLETIFAPFVDDNELEFEAELNLVFLREEWTQGWLEAHFDIVDKFSPAERPGADRAYTHKLNLELDVAFLPFNALPAENWFRNVELETSLDYVATGLPRQGDVIDGERFLDDASGWSISFLLVVPVAPVAR